MTLLSRISSMINSSPPLTISGSGGGWRHRPGTGSYGARDNLTMLKTGWNLLIEGGRWRRYVPFPTFLITGKGPSLRWESFREGLVKRPRWLPLDPVDSTLALSLFLFIISFLFWFSLLHLSILDISLFRYSFPVMAAFCFLSTFLYHFTSFMPLGHTIVLLYIKSYLLSLQLVLVFPQFNFSPV